MTELKFKRIICRPKPGAYIDDCKSEAMKMAADYNCDVEFNHNGRIYIAEINLERTRIHITDRLEDLPVED